MMPVPKAWMKTARRVLAGQLDRLREFLGSWGRCLRDRLAGAAGEAVTGVLRALLDVPADVDSRPSPARRYPDWEAPSWRDPYGRPTEDPDRPSWRDADEERWEDEPEESDPVTYGRSSHHNREPLAADAGGGVAGAGLVAAPAGR